jgi:hypothetical protein
MYAEQGPKLYVGWSLLGGMNTGTCHQTPPDGDGAANGSPNLGRGVRPDFTVR